MSTTKTHSPGKKHVPQRTCVACREVKTKHELVRVVRTPDGNIELDSTGKKNGRGAYICPNRDCWEKALTGIQLERTLHSNITEKNREELRISGKTLFKGAS
ncbi:MAG TPA: YlxR family protein [Dehalococcoidia bacterium]|nr:YlxR family protein [Dehalococcoidia bacterium]